jgi:hypothetical protein
MLRILRPLAVASTLWVAGLTLPATAATLLSGAVEYEVDLTAGFADVTGFVADGDREFSFDIFGLFKGGTAGEDPTADLFVFDAAFDPILSGTLSMVEVDLAGGSVMALFDLSTASDLFSGATQALVTLRSSSFASSFAGEAFVEIGRVDAPTAIPLPASMLLLLAGLGMTALPRAMSSRRTHRKPSPGGAGELYTVTKGIVGQRGPAAASFL